MNSGHSSYLCDNSLLNSRNLYDYRHPIDILDSLNNNLDSAIQRSNIMKLEPQILEKNISNKIVDNDGLVCNKNNLVRGPCGKCSEPVLVSQSRYINENGQYCHKVCNNLYEFTSTTIKIPENAPNNGLLKNNIENIVSTSSLNSSEF